MSTKQGSGPNILALGKGDNKALLEQACRQLVDADSPRAVSYTAVKQRLAALRAQVHARPTTTDAPPPPAPRIDPAPGSRDTRGAHLAGPEHFSLDALLGKTDPAHDEGGQA